MRQESIVQIKLWRPQAETRQTSSGVAGVLTSSDSPVWLDLFSFSLLCTRIKGVFFLISCRLCVPACLFFSTHPLFFNSSRYTHQDEPFNHHSPPCIKLCTFSPVNPHSTAWSLYACRSEGFEQTQYSPNSPRWPITWTCREIQQMAPQMENGWGEVLSTAKICTLN